MFDEVCDFIRSINNCPDCNNVLHEVHTELSYFKHIHCTNCYKFSFIIQPNMFDNNNYEIRLKYLKLNFYIMISNINNNYNWVNVFHYPSSNNLSHLIFENSKQALDYMKNINKHHNKILRMLVIS